MAFNSEQHQPHAMSGAPSREHRERPNNESLRNRPAGHFLYSPRGIAPYPGGGYAQVHTDAGAIEVVRFNPSDQNFSTERRFQARHRTTQNGNTRSIEKPWDIAVSSDKEFFITNGSPFVHVYDEIGIYKRRFAAISPDGGASNELQEPNSALHGITVNHRGQIMVGDTNYNYISVLTTSGQHINSLSVQVQPKFIASTPLDHFVVSACNSTPAQIVDIETGQEVKSLFPPKDEHVGMWCPSGVYCSWKEEEIFIANQMGKVGIYSFTLEGEFLECFEQDVTVPWGIAVSDDEKYLFVSNSDESGKSIFETDKNDCPTSESSTDDDSASDEDPVTSC